MKPSSPLYILWLLVLSVGVVACTTEGERRQMAQIIAEADSMNRNYVPMTSDSLLLQACAFYDRHGSPNERMKAHYLLGCVYRDLGEAPHAIDCYQQAADCADTLDSDCDYHTLGCIYSQMGEVFHQQLLFSNEIEVGTKAIHYYQLAHDTLSALQNLEFSAGTYILMNKMEDAETAIKKAIRSYNVHGYDQEALRATIILMHIYAMQPQQLLEFKELIDKLEQKWNAFDSSHELSLSNRHYYYYKGQYYEMKGDVDSAEYYYRKIYHDMMDYREQVPLYKGLLSVFQKQNIADSIAKYAQLYCEVNDSSIAIKDQDLTARLTASYRYNTIQKQSLDNAEKANRRMQIAIALLFVAFLAIAAAFYFRRRYMEKKHTLEKLKSEFAEATDRYDKNL